MGRITSIQEQQTPLSFRPEKSLQSLRERRRDPALELKKTLIKEIVKKAFIELGVSLAFAGVACIFVANPIAMATLFICAVAAVAISTLLRGIGAYCTYRLFQLKYDESSESILKKSRFKKCLGFVKYLTPMAFSQLVDHNTRAVITHEMGHALAANILIKNPNTRVSIVPFDGGRTTYRLGPLTKLGEFFGRAKTKLIVAAAGPALGVLTATAGFGASLALRKSHPELSRYLNVAAIDTIGQHVFYALSALWTSAAQTSHDFLQLMAGGVHPLVSAVSIVALPILVRIGFYIYDKIKEKRMAKIQAKEQLHLNKNYSIKIPPTSKLEIDK
ncbi:MAG: hypothetical protein BGO14_03645 [Chlamydiales bacterium 38-26]|nr:hypothetical protein [Chlamydiales bacterium]OJV09427.1 MAG: hypothetical protein BGO14_03645 [Chlamydiales bacterium 38-26]